jgi:hypothetical protein
VLRSPSQLVGRALPFVLSALGFGATPVPPRLLVEAPGAATSLLRRPDGSFAFYDRRHPNAGPVVLPDREGRRHTLLPALPPHLAGSKTVLESDVLNDSQVILTPAGQLISVRVRGEKLDSATARRVGLTHHLDLWLTRAGSRTAEPARRIWSGYNGSQMEVQAGPGGRIFVPFGRMIPHAKALPPYGRHETMVLFSDDGQTWQESATRLTAPCYEGFNGNNEGACEPTLEPLRDGRLWLLLRTQTGFLYESTSSDNGTTWGTATASRFNTSTGPANLLRHRNGWLVLSWNNCEMPRRANGEGVYGGRDALHLAVSTDEGATWRGFREVYLDFRRNDNPAKSGDRGTAYPLGAYTEDGRIVVIAGQGSGGRHPILIDPDWIVATRAQTDFSDGLAQWSVYKHHGPAQRWWRARAVGGALVPDPENPSMRSLHLRKNDDLPADAAVWNFPNGWKGTLTTRVRVQPGFAGGMICLNDRFFDPTETLGRDFAVFAAPLGTNGAFGNRVLTPGRWHELILQWDLSAQRCALFLDGRPAGERPLAHETLNGISYVRFLSTARGLDPAGFLVGSVRVEIADAFAPVQRPAELRRHEQRYIGQVVPRWREKE